MRALFLLLFASALAHGQDIPIPCPSGDIKVCAYDALVASPAKRLPTWRSWLDMPLEERVGPAPRDVIELLALDNLYNGYPGHPHASAANEALKADVIAVLEQLPESVKRRVSDRIAGIVFVDDFGGAAFTDSIVDEKGRKARAFVVLDPTLLAKRTANALATSKEGMPFKPDGHHELRATIEKPNNDNRRQAIQYILLPELGRAISITGEIHFPQARSGMGKAGTKISAAEMVVTYKQLEATSFPTLYAATHPADDFAESFANYVHVVMMGRPFEIALSEEGRVVKRHGPCWSESRCAAKRKILETFLR
jgi:hypothetical protein